MVNEQKSAWLYPYFYQICKELTNVIKKNISFIFIYLAC